MSEENVQPQVEANNQKPCPFCAEMINVNAKKCRYCGETLDVALRAAEDAKRNTNQPIIVNNNNNNNMGSQLPLSPKSRAVYIVLALLFGLAGIHNFYAGYILSGLLQLILSCTVFGLFIVVPWVIIDILFTTRDRYGLHFA